MFVICWSNAALVGIEVGGRGGGGEVGGLLSDIQSWYCVGSPLSLGSLHLWEKAVMSVINNGTGSSITTVGLLSLCLPPFVVLLLLLLVLLLL